MASGTKGIRAGRAFVELFADDSKLVRGLRRAQAKLKAFGASVRHLGTRLVALGAAVAGPLLIASTKVFTSMGDALDKMSQRTGLSVEALSELSFAAEQSGQTGEQLEAVLIGMTRQIRSLERGLSTAVEAFDDLGLTYAEIKNLSPEDQFTLIAERLSKIEDPTRRAGLAMQVFGRAGRNLIPLLSLGAKGIAQMRQEARELGIVMSTQDAKQAAALTDALNRLKHQIKTITFQVGAALAPMLLELSDKIKRVFKSVIDWAKRNKQLVLTVFKVAAGVIAIGGSLVALGLTISIIGTAFGALGGVLALVGKAFLLIGTLVGALLSPVGLAVAAVVGLGAALLKWTGAGGKALSWLSQQFGRLQEFAQQAIGGIRDALAAGDIELAAKVLWLGLKVLWTKGVAEINNVWQEWKTFFLRVVTEAQFLVANILTNAWAGLQTAWVETVDFLADAWTTFTGGLMRGWRTAQNFISKGVLRLMSLFDDSIDVAATSKALDDDLARANNAQRNAANRAVAQREQKRRERLAEIEQERAGTLEGLERDNQRRNEELTRQQGAAIGAAERELAEARHAFQQAVGEAGRKRAAIPDGKEGSLADVLAGDAPEGVDKATKAVSGTFNAAGALGLQAAGPSDRIAKAVEAMDKKMAQLVREAQHAKIVFA